MAAALARYPDWPGSPVHFGPRASFEDHDFPDAAEATTFSLNEHDFDELVTPSVSPGLSYASMESVLQVASLGRTRSQTGQSDSLSSRRQTLRTPTGILTPRALLDHLNLIGKILRLEVTVGKRKWRFRDLCKKADLPIELNGHYLQVGQCHKLLCNYHCHSLKLT
ncbi:unnamed protein product [Protopolystoma xenopodis]|uniref:Uncharacterized protein n=1 Tax=Protopolystoma xenopodis TaxID=117903 RepID=A0A3S5BWB2_9PLAT|nr:unnamed protein product [Protopolystoma xenopodis]